MAFSKAPSQSTYQTEEIKLIYSLDNRSNTKVKDFISKNGIFEVTKGGATKDDLYTFFKRNGVSAYAGVLASSNIRGMYHWEDQDKLLVASDDNITIFVGSTGTLSTTLTPFTTTTGEVGFSEFNFDDGSTKVVIGDGTTLITVDSSNTVAVCFSPDLPPFEPSILTLDGYLFLIKTGTQDIYNSNLGDPLLWTAGDFITAEMIPDNLVRISRLSNYLIALGTASVEYFFDAGNAEASPLQRNDTPVKSIGFLGGYATYSNNVIFVGQSSTTSPEVYILEDFKMDMVESPMLKRYLKKDSVFTATMLSMAGHDFYVLTVDGLTFALDMNTKVWARWGLNSTETLPCQFATNVIVSGSGHVAVFSILGQSGVYFFNPDTYQDLGVNFDVVLQTPKQRFNTYHEKFMSRLIPVTDKTTGLLYVSWSDDDYATYTTERTIDLSIEQPKIHRLGRFVERGFRFRFEDNSPLRMYYVAVDYNIGLK